MQYSILKTLRCQQGAVRKVRFNVDGTYCLTAGSNKSIKLWNPHKGLFLKTYSGHSNDVLDVSSSCDSSSILSGSEDKCLIQWDVTTGKAVRRLRSHVSGVNCVKFNEESTVAISGSYDNTVMLWDLKAFNIHPIQVLKDAKDSIVSLVVTNYEILTASLDGKIRCYDIRQGMVYTGAQKDPITCLSLTGDEQCYAVSTTASVIYLYEKKTGSLLSQFTGHSTGQYCLENGIDQSDKYLLSGSEDGIVYCWDIVSGEIHDQLLHEHRPVVHSLSVHPLSPFLMTAFRSEVALWGEQPLED